MINNKLLTELEIIKDHCNDTGLKAGAGVIEEVIEILKSKNIIEKPDNLTVSVTCSRN